jgi:hypothetical protein
MKNSNEMILKALLDSGKVHAPDVPEELLRKAFEIQINYQFEKDESIPLKQMQNLIEQYLAGTK